MRLVEVYRITVFVPATHLDVLVTGIVAVDELSMGDYGEVMWMSPRVTEQFRPGAAARPTEGAAGELSHIDSVRVEFAIPRDAARLDRLLREGIHANHPWEVPAVFIDEALFPLPERT